MVIAVCMTFAGSYCCLDFLSHAIVSRFSFFFSFIVGFKLYFDNYITQRQPSIKMYSDFEVKCALVHRTTSIQRMPTLKSPGILVRRCMLNMAA